MDIQSILLAHVAAIKNAAYARHIKEKKKSIKKGRIHMLSETQEKWIKNKENQLTQLIQNNWPLSDDDWTFVADFLSKTMTLARDNKEIRKRLLDILEFYDKKDKAEKRQKK